MIFAADTATCPTHPVISECTPVPVLQLAAGAWSDWTQEDGISGLGRALNAAMADSPAARAAYLATWGVEWQPLPYFEGDTGYSYSTGDRYPDTTPHRRTGGVGVTGH